MTRTAELTEQETTRVERGLAVLALATHTPITGYEHDSSGTRTARKVCRHDQTRWPCAYYRWAQPRIETGPLPETPS